MLTLHANTLYVFANLSDEYEHQYVISFFELSYNEPTLTKKQEYRMIESQGGAPPVFRLSFREYK